MSEELCDNCLHDDLENRLSQQQTIDRMVQCSDMIKALSATNRVGITVIENVTGIYECSIALDSELRNNLKEVLAQEILVLTGHLGNLMAAQAVNEVKKHE